MPIIKSAIKRMHQAATRRARNQQTKRGLKAAVKAFTAKMSGDSLSKAQSEIDKAVKKNLLDKNTAARRKAALAAAAKKAGVKVAGKAEAKPKAATKPAKAVTPVKKAVPAKKAATPAKKPVAKRTAAKKVVK